MGWIPALALIGCMLGGCAGGSRSEKDSASGEVITEKISTQAEEAVNDTAGTESETVWYEGETETDIFGEVMMRSVWEVYPADVQKWAASFDESQVQSLLYRTYMEEEPHEYVITDSDIIRMMFEAVDQLQVAGTLGAPAPDGDVIRFTMTDGTEQTIAFSMGCIKVDSEAYETSGSDSLWELTADIMFGFEDPQTEY